MNSSHWTPVILTDKGNTGPCPQSPLQGDWRQSSLLGLATMLGCRFWIIDYVHTSWMHEKLNRRALKTSQDCPNLRFNTFHGWSPAEGSYSSQASLVIFSAYTDQKKSKSIYSSKRGRISKYDKKIYIIGKILKNILIQNI